MTRDPRTQSRRDRAAAPIRRPAPRPPGSRSSRTPPDQSRLPRGGRAHPAGERLREAAPAAASKWLDPFAQKAAVAWQNEARVVAGPGRGRVLAPEPRRGGRCCPAGTRGLSRPGRCPSRGPGGATPQGQGEMTSMWFSTSVTPGAAQAAVSASFRATSACTLPRRTTRLPLDSTVMSLASRSARR